MSRPRAFLCFEGKVAETHEKPRLMGPRGVLGEWAFSYWRGTPVGRYQRPYRAPSAHGGGGSRMCVALGLRGCQSTSFRPAVSASGCVFTRRERLCCLPVGQVAFVMTMSAALHRPVELPRALRAHPSTEPEQAQGYLAHKKQPTSLGPP